MERRKLRIVKTTPDVLGVCERCKSQFTSIRPNVAEAKPKSSLLLTLINACLWIAAKTPLGSFARRSGTGAFQRNALTRQNR
jgi:hypothetical protein